MVRKISFLVPIVGFALWSWLSPQPILAGQSQVSRRFMVPPASFMRETPDDKKEAIPEVADAPGKYLVGDPISIRVETRPFELSLCAGVNNNAGCGALDQPPSIGSIFHLKATDESGNPVRFSANAILGKADVYPYDGAIAAVRIRPKGAGKLVLEATAQSNPISRSVILYVAGAPGSELSSCARLFPPLFPKPPVIDAATIVGLIGAPQPYSLVALTKDQILIYSTHPQQDSAKGVLKKILEDIRQQIKRLISLTPADLGVQATTKFSVELSVPHASSLGDLRAKISSINSSEFTATTVGSDKIRITSPAQPECEAWSGFLSNLQRLVWQISPESPVARLFYLEPPDVSKVLGGGGGSGSGAAPSTGSGGTQPAAPAAGATTAAGTPGTAPANTTAAPATGGTAPPAQPAGPSSGTSTPTARGDSPPPSKTLASILPLSSDLLVFNASNLGDDADVTEKKRVIALLDLPRPEMIINAWVMQNSSKDPNLVSGFSDTVARTVSAFNEALEASVSRAWSYLSARTATPDAYFEEEFYRYIALRYIGELPYRPGFPVSSAQGAQEVLELRSSAAFTKEQRESHKACGPNEYCLGYGALFHTLKPRLTELLLTVIAAKAPLAEAQGAIKAMESQRTGCGRDAENPDYCEKLSSRLRISNLASNANSEQDCTVRDLVKIHKTASVNAAPILHLHCFRDKAESIFGLAPGTSSQVGLLRAAIADFLFNYKMSQQYPHEFWAYDLSQSADTLNAALSPFIEGFNQDLKAFQEFLQEDLRYRVEKLPGASGGFFRGGKQSFINNGIVSVRTISGKTGSVDTTSQSFLDASSAPKFSDLLKAVVDQSPAKGANGDPTGVLGNVSFNQAQVILGALEAFKPTTVQIGRSLNLKVAPRSLSAASAAEIDVTLSATESAPPAYFGGPKGAQPPDTSRVATHNTTTRVRVDSLKLFEVSSFSAELQRSRSRFPLLPPFVEIPYIGTLIGIPLPPAKQYHTSTAVLSAVVLPTAADLAYGLSFISDRILDPPGSGDCGLTGETPGMGKSICVRRALSLRDLHQPIRGFNKGKVSCFAALQTPQAKCHNLTFDQILRDPSER